MDVRAHAKINLLLSVRPGADASGYHAVETAMCPLELADEVRVLETGRPGVELACEPDPLHGAPPERNLAFRAALAVGKAFGRPVACRVEIVKRIPAQAGLGGGSSDAAAVMRCLALLWGEDPLDPRLVRAAAELGADVPFFLGDVPALLTGRGDVLVERFAPFGLPVALVKPPVGVPTGAAYALLYRLRPPELPAALLVEALSAGDAARAAACCGNNMEGAARVLAPELDGVFSFLAGRPEALGAPLLCGSGSCVALFVRDAAAAGSVAAEARKRGWWSCATATFAG